MADHHTSSKDGRLRRRIAAAAATTAAGSRRRGAVARRIARAAVCAGAIVAAVVAAAGAAPPAAAAPGDVLWRKTFEGGVVGGQDQAFRLVFAPKGFFYVVGFADRGAPTGVDATVLKYSAAGSRKWKRFYDGPAHGGDRTYDAVVDKAGDLYVCGSRGRADGTTDVLLIKYTPGGKRLWVRAYDGPRHGSDYARELALDGAGNVYVAGTVGDPADPVAADLRLLKYSPGGQRRWVRGFDPGAEHHLSVSGLQVDRAHGRIYVGAMYQVTTDDWQWFIARYAGDGTRRWWRSWGDSGSDQAEELALGADGGIYQVGSATLPPAGDCDATIVKWTAAGAVAVGWPEYHNGPGNGDDHLYDVTVDRTGKVHAVGDSRSAVTQDNAFMRCFDAAGTPLWNWTYSHDGAQTLWHVACDRAGNTYAGGYSNESGANPAYLVVKKPVDATPSWIRTVKESTTTTSGTDTLHDLAWRGGDYAGVYVTGNGDGDTSEWDFFTLRFEP